MRTVSKRLVDLQNAVIPLGFVGENLHTQIRLDGKRVFDDYPSAIPSLTVKPPQGDPYPAVVSRDGDIVIWDVEDSDLVYQGDGEIQLAFTVDEVVVKSYIGKTRISRSIIPTGTVPTPVQNWIDQANTVLGEIPVTIATAIDEALAEAKASGEFDGEDGFSPVVTVSEISGGHSISIEDAEGTQTFNVMDGEDGDPGTPGYSPTATVTKSGKVATITITDKNGTTTATVSDGEDGSDVIDDTAGTGTANKTWSANKLVTEFGKKYQKPSSGIPSTDLASAVQTSLGKADSAYQKPSGGIPSTDIASGVIPVLTDLIDDTAGDGTTNKTWSADKLYDLNSALTALDETVDDALDGIGTPGTTVTGGVVSFDSTGKTVEQISISDTSATSATLTRTGKNMYPKYSSDSANSLSWTVASDGTITFSGTPTADTLLRLQNLYIPMTGDTFYVALHNNMTNSKLSFFGIRPSGQGNWQVNMTSNNTVAGGVFNADIIELRLRIPKDMSATGLVIKPMLVHGSEVGDFEEYKGQTYTVTVEDGVVQDEITLLDGVNTIWSSVSGSPVDTSVKFSGEQGKVTDYVAEQIDEVRDSFYSYETSGSARYLYIYYKSGGKYVRWQLHNVPAVASNSDTWQIGRVCGLDGDFANLTEIVRGGEFELAFKEHGADDYCGGNNHGDENTDVFKLFIDGKLISDLSTLADGERHPFNRIDAFEVATVNRCNTPEEDILTHQKRWVFENGKVTVYETVKVLENLSVDVMMCCMFAALRSSFTYGIRQGGVAIEDMTTSSYSKVHTVGNDMSYLMYGDHVTAKISSRLCDHTPRGDLWINPTSDLNKLYYGFTGLTNSADPVDYPANMVVSWVNEYEVAYNKEVTA